MEYSYKRDEDQITDDRNRLVSLKKELLELLGRAVLYSLSKTAVDDYIGVEEAFDDLLNSQWESLREEDNSYDELPISPYQLAWLKESRAAKNRLAMPPHNPATLIAKGVDICE